MANPQLSGLRVPAEGIGRQFQRDVGYLLPTLEIENGDAIVVVDLATHEQAVAFRIQCEVVFLHPFAQVPFIH